MRMRREFLSNCVVFFFFPFSCQEMTRKKKRKEKKEGKWRWKKELVKCREEKDENHIFGSTERT